MTDEIQNMMDMIGALEDKITALSADGTNHTPELNAALAAAQGAFEPIVKNRHVKVKMRDGSNYEFDYADLSAVIAATSAALSKNGLATSYRIGSGRIAVELRHSSGEILSTYLPLNIPDGRPQELGSLITYYRRYLISGLLGVDSETDDDGNAAQGNERTISPKGPPAVAPKQQPKPAPARPPPPEGRISPEQLNQLTKKFKATNPPWTIDQMRAFSKNAFGCDSAQDLKQNDFNLFMSALDATYAGACAVYCPEEIDRPDATKPPEEKK